MITWQIYGSMIGQKLGTKKFYNIGSSVHIWGRMRQMTKPRKTRNPSKNNFYSIGFFVHLLMTNNVEELPGKRDSSSKIFDIFFIFFQSNFSKSMTTEQARTRSTDIGKKTWSVARSDCYVVNFHFHISRIKKYFVVVGRENISE